MGLGVQIPHPRGIQKLIPHPHGGGDPIPHGVPMGGGGGVQTLVQDDVFSNFSSYIWGRLVIVIWFWWDKQKMEHKTPP